jgi:tetratricopeptide (TPR) repeat protein
MRRHFLVSVLLFLGTLGVFSRVLQADLLAWDDEALLSENASVHGLGAHRLAWMFTNVSYAMRYRPLSWLSYALIYTGAGLNPLAYHLANLIFHCLNAVMLYFVLLEVFTLAHGSKPDSERHPWRLAWCAALCALVWAVHPLRVEAVAWVTALTYCQALFFLLISLWCYLRGNRRSLPESARRGFYWSAVAAFGLSILSYPFAFGYAVVLVALDFHPLHRFNCRPGWWRDAATRRIWLEKVPFVLLGGMVLLTFLGRLRPVGVWSQLQSSAGLTIWGKAMQALYIWAYYLWKPWVPFHLSPVYTTLVSFDPGSLLFLASGGLVVGLTVLLVWKRRQWPWALALWACHLALLGAALGLTEHPHYPTDRYSYIPGILWSLGLAAVLLSLRQKPRALAGAGATLVVLVLVLGEMSARQTRIWRNSTTLFQYMLATLGNDPYRSDIHWRLGRAYARELKWDEAIREYRVTLAMESKLPAHYLLAQALQAQGKFEEAMDHYAVVLRNQPDAQVHVAVAELLADQGRVPEAIAHYREALRLEPKFWPALNNLAWILATDADPANRDGHEAVRLAEQSCLLTQQREPMLLGTLAAAYAESGRFPKAAEMAERARDLAESAGDHKLAARNRELLELYRSSRPFHQGTAASTPTSK